MPLSILQSLLRLLSRAISPLDAKGCSRDMSTHLALISLKKSQITSCILNFITRKFAKCLALSLISAETEPAQTGGSNNVGTLDIKIEVRTQRTGLSGAFVAINLPLKIAKINGRARP